jgi:hypothetical protein
VTKPLSVLEALEGLAIASRNQIVTHVRYVNGTGGGVTDEEMDARTKEWLDATEAAFAALSAVGSAVGDRPRG